MKNIEISINYIFKMKYIIKDHTCNDPDSLSGVKWSFTTYENG
jgi:hypothetical protein